MASTPHKTEPLDFLLTAAVLLWPVLRWVLALLVVVFLVMGSWFIALGCFALLAYLCWWIAYGKPNC